MLRPSASSGRCPFRTATRWRPTPAPGGEPSTARAPPFLRGPRRRRLRPYARTGARARSHPRESVRSARASRLACWSPRSSPVRRSSSHLTAPTAISTFSIAFTPKTTSVPRRFSHFVIIEFVDIRFSYYVLILLIMIK